MHDRRADLIAGVAVLVFIAMWTWLFYGIGYTDGEKDMKAQAIKAGAGRYEADPSTGDTRFVFGKAAKAGVERPAR